MLPRTALKGTSSPAPAPTPNQTAAVRENATVLAGLVRVQPVFSQGKLSGYRIFPGGARGSSTFNQLGLRAGDLITAINGTALDDAARAMEIMQTLSSSATATVTVSRNGQSQDVNLNLANLNTEADAPGGDNPAGGPAQQPVLNGPVQMRGRGGFPGAAGLPPPGSPAAMSPPADTQAANAAENSER